MKNGAILLIDDNKAELRLCHEAMKIIQTEHLASLPRHELITFNSSVEALDYLKDSIKEVFIIICDINMPGMSGMQLLEKINKDADLRLQAIPFIFLSNSSERFEIEHAYSLAAQGYFLKPLSLHELVEIFKAIITYWNLARIPRDVLFE